MLVHAANTVLIPRHTKTLGFHKIVILKDLEQVFTGLFAHAVQRLEDKTKSRRKSMGTKSLPWLFFFDEFIAHVHNHI
jgi:hypothetical protein